MKELLNPRKMKKFGDEGVKGARGCIKRRFFYFFIFLTNVAFLSDYPSDLASKWKIFKATPQTAIGVELAFYNSWIPFRQVVNDNWMEDKFFKKTYLRSPLIEINTMGIEMQKL